MGRMLRQSLLIAGPLPSNRLQSASILSQSQGKGSIVG